MHLLHMRHPHSRGTLCKQLPRRQALTKYKLAGEMATRVIKAVREACVAGKKTIEICDLGDELIMKEVAGVYNKKDKETNELIRKGAM